MLIGIVFTGENGAVAQKNILQNGDLLFIVNKSSDFTDAIVASTAKKQSLPYTHVGIVYIDNDSVFVIEATPPLVCKTYIADFVKDIAKDATGKYLASLARVKKKYQYLLPTALQKANLCISKPYDYLFSPSDSSFYCSELVWYCYRLKNGKPMFKQKIMSFKGVNSSVSDEWIEYFARHNATVPQSEYGTNPVDMSQSNKIKIIALFYEFI